MTLQTTVRAFQTTGLPGELAREAPLVALPWILDSSGTPNIIGHAFTKVADGKAQVGGDISGGDVFLGILGRPKEHALVGIGTSSLLPTDVLGDEVVGTLISEGFVYVQLSDVSAQSADGDVGTALFFVDATGIISAGTAGTGESVIPNAVIAIEDVAEDGLAIVKLG